MAVFKFSCTLVMLWTIVASAERKQCAPNCMCITEGAETRINCIGSNITSIRAARFPTTSTHLDIFQSRLGVLKNLTFVGLPELREIKLESNQIRRIQVGALAGLKNVEVVSLQKNQLSSLPNRAFAELGSLRKLDLSENGIIHAFQHTFKGLDSLEELNLQNNKLSTLPNWLFTPLKNLKHLDLRWNRLQEISVSSFCTLTELRTLDLSHNQIRLVPSELTRCFPKLRVIRLSHNNIWNVAASAFKFAPQLEEISLDNNRLADLDSRTFTNHSSLVTVNISRNELIFVSAELFTGLPALRYVHLGGNPYICDSMLRTFAEFVKNSTHIFWTHQVPSARCASPVWHRNKLLLVVDPEQFVDPTTTTLPTTTTAFTLTLPFTTGPDKDPLEGHATLSPPGLRDTNRRPMKRKRQDTDRLEEGEMLGIIFAGSIGGLLLLFLFCLLLYHVYKCRFHPDKSGLPKECARRAQVEVIKTPCDIYDSLGSQTRLTPVSLHAPTGKHSPSELTSLDQLSNGHMPNGGHVTGNGQLMSPDIVPSIAEEMSLSSGGQVNMVPVYHTGPKGKKIKLETLV